MKKKLLLLLTTLCLSFSLFACTEKPIEDVPQNSETSEQTTTPQPSEVTPTEEIEEIIDPWKDVDITKYTNSGYDTIEGILANELYEKMEKKETFVVYLGKENCKWCKIVLPILAEADMQDIPVYYLNTGYFGENYPEDSDSEEYDIVYEQHILLQETMNYKSVPCIRYIENGELVYGISNPLSGSYYSEDTTDEEREVIKQRCLTDINDLFILLKDGSENIPEEKITIWNDFVTSLWVEEEEDNNLNFITEEVNPNDVLSSAEMTMEELWALEKEYGMRLVPEGEISYWDTVDEMPPNE